MDITHPNDIDAGLATCLRLCIFDDNWMRRSLLDAHLYISTPLKVGNVLVAWDDDSTPVGWMSYAYFNDETREAFMRGDCLREEDWHSGEEFWVVDFVAVKYGQEIMMAVKDLLPDGMAVNWWRGKNDKFHEKVVRH